MIALDLLLLALALPALAAAGYLGLLTLLSRRPPARPGAVGPRFALIVPAHDEEAGIGGTVANLRGLDYPASLRRVLVVADNCADRTAQVAAAAGATVLVREDPSRRGKGHALEFAFAHVLAEGWADAVVVIDADTRASANLLRAFAARLAEGAQALQADNRVGNVRASWRTLLMAIALGAFHRLRSLGRERLGVSCALAGNGMAFTRDLLRAVPHRAFSIVEDLEYALRLAEAGRRVRYVDEARVCSEIASTSRAAADQRRRWDGGRRGLGRREGPRLLRLALARRDLALGELAFNLLLPPLARLGALVALGTLLAALVAAGSGPGLALYAWGVALALLALYVVRGWQLSETGWRGAVGLLAAPAYVLWKLALLLERRPRRPGEWVRTAREKEERRWAN